LSRVREINIGRWRVFGNDEIEIFYNTCFFTVLGEACNMMHDIFWFTIELGERGNKGLSLSGAVGGTKGVTKSACIDKGHEEEAEDRQVD
jgi:hypothetical protein